MISWIKKLLAEWEAKRQEMIMMEKIKRFFMILLGGIILCAVVYCVGKVKTLFAGAEAETEERPFWHFW